MNSPFVLLVIVVVLYFFIMFTLVFALQINIGFNGIFGYGYLILNDSLDS